MSTPHPVGTWRAALAITVAVALVAAISAMTADYHWLVGLACYASAFLLFATLSAEIKGIRSKSLKISNVPKDFWLVSGTSVVLVILGTIVFLQKTTTSPSPVITTNGQGSPGIMGGGTINNYQMATTNKEAAALLGQCDSDFCRLPFKLMSKFTSYL
jgi:predicted neutral ceramidase superfamily lipid hydrolase